MILKVEMLRPGKFTDMNGQAVEFTPEILQQIVRDYSPYTFEAPLIFGHSDDVPYGQVTRLEFNQDNSITAYIDGLSDACSMDGANNIMRIRYCSAGLYQPGAPGNPIGDNGYYLQHIAAILYPAVKPQAEPELVVSAAYPIMLSDKPPSLLFSESMMNHQKKCACADELKESQKQNVVSLSELSAREKQLAEREKSQIALQKELDKKSVSLFLAEHKNALTPAQAGMAESILLSAKSNLYLSEKGELSDQIEKFIASFSAHQTMNTVLFSEAAGVVRDEVQESITAKQVSERLAMRGKK